MLYCADESVTQMGKMVLNKVNCPSFWGQVKIVKEVKLEAEARDSLNGPQRFKIRNQET